MKTQKGFATILAIIIGLVIVGGGIYAIKTTKTMDEAVENVDIETQRDEVLEPEEVVNAKQEDPVEVIANDNWLTYSNDKYGFEFSYPTSILNSPITTDSYGITTIVFNNKLNEKIDKELNLVKASNPLSEEPIHYPIGTIINPSLWITIIDKSLNRNADDLGYAQSSDYEKTAIGNFFGYKPKDRGGAGIRNAVMIVKLQDGSYIDSIIMDKRESVSCSKGICTEAIDDQETKELFDKIISTFKFKTFPLTQGGPNESSNQTEKEIGFIKDIYLEKGNYYLDMDYVMWVTAGNEQSIELCGKDEMSNGYCVINDNSLIRTFPISDNVIVKMATFSHDESGNFNGDEVVSLEKFISIYDGDIMPTQTIKDLAYSGRSYDNYFDDALYWVTIKDGVIIEIQQQYQP